MIDYPEIFKGADAMLKIGVASNNLCVTCSKGCSSCCSEPVYSRESEVDFIVGKISKAWTRQEKDALEARTEAWKDRFVAAGFLDVDTPKVMPYRASKNPCPLLAADGSCSIYEIRPLECRLFIATGPREACEDDSRRQHGQKFPDFPQITGAIVGRIMKTMDDGADTTDHFGLLLANKICGTDLKSKSAMTTNKKGDQAWPT